MKIKCVLLLLLISLVQCVAFGEVKVSKSDDLVVLDKGLEVARVGSYRRNPLHKDPLEAIIVAGKWVKPKAGDKITDAEGNDYEWTEAKADENGWYTGSGGYGSGGGYLFVPVYSEAERVMILHMKGNNSVTVNGQPHVGSRYQRSDVTDPWAPSFDFVRVPIKLNKGNNEFLFQRSRRSGGRLKARLLKPESDIVFNTFDSTLPDILEGKGIDSFGSIVLINATDKQQNKLAFTAKWPDGKKTVVKIPGIAPLSSRKVRFDLKHDPVDAEGEIKVKLSVHQKGKSKAYDSVDVPLKIKKPGQHYKITYISSVDNSVQYYSVVPAVGGGKGAKPGMVLSVHGASVEATNQAGSYSNKSWCNIVCPTNRRPYGFDWEDWGMIDAVEVLEDAKSVLGCDDSRVYLTGHSMGGHGTWIIGATYPDLFGAIGPSAGWISFKTYAGGRGEDESASEMGKMLVRAENHGDTTGLMENLTDKGVYILHGGADKTVPPSQAQKMAEYLGEFHKDWVYHEEPGKGHWWNLSDEPGADCVDWRPMFDFFARHRLVADNEIRKVKFTTCNPSVNSKSHWVEIYDQLKSLEFSTVDILADPHKRRFVGTTENVRVVVLDTSVLLGEGPVTVELDGQKLAELDEPAEDGKLWFALTDKKWALSGEPSKKMKGPHRFGPFKAGFDNNMMFVYGTKGNDAENTWALAKARFDAEQWWYQGNGSVDIIADADFTLKGTKDRGVVLYGNRRTNSAWNKLLRKSPVQVNRRMIRVGKRQIAGKDLACLFVHPRPDSDVASVAVVSGTGIGGMTLTNNLQYLFAGCHYPDLVVIGPEMNEKGVDGVVGAGYFGSDWSVDKGDFIWKDRKTGEDQASSLPAYIGPDPREFTMPRNYICMKTVDQINVDGKLDEESWSKAVWSEPHVDIQGSERPVTPRFETRFKMVWDDDNLYVGAKLSEPHVWGTITKRNEVIFNDNDFEVFIDPDGDCHSYYEFEMNALNTVWNLLMNKPYKHGGSAVVREMEGQQSGVFIKGTLNEPTDEDEYWTVEIAFAFKGMKEHAGVDCPPADKDQWRIGFSRVEWEHKVVEGKYERVPAIGAPHASGNEENWIWSPQGVVNMHRPETWGYLQYSQKSVGTAGVEFIDDETAKARYLLFKILYAQEEYVRKNGQYAKDLEELNLGKLKDKSLASPIRMISKEKGYIATAKVKLADGKIAIVNVSNNGRTWTE